MPRSRTAPVARLFELFLLSIDKIGIKNTNKALRVEIKKYQSLFNSDALFIASAVAEIFEIPVEEIFYGTGRKNDRRYAVGMCAYYLHYIYEYDMEEVCYALRKDNEWAVYKYSQTIKNLNPAHASDRRYIEFKKLMDIRVTGHRKLRKKKLRNEKQKRA